MINLGFISELMNTQAAELIQYQIKQTQDERKLKEKFPIVEGILKRTALKKAAWKLNLKNCNLKADKTCSCY